MDYVKEKHCIQRHHKEHQCTEDYCKSVESILCSEANITECSEDIFCCNLLKWLNEIPDVDKRISYLIQVLAAYGNRAKCVSNILCASKDLIKICNGDDICQTYCIGNGVYILQKVIFNFRKTGNNECCFLVYYKQTEKLELRKYSSQYDSKNLKTVIYNID